MKKVTKQTLSTCVNFGLLISVAFILTSYIYFQKGFDILVNPQVANINYMLCISGIFIGLRKLRSEVMPLITYWQAFLAGSTMMAVAAIPFAIFMYFILSSNPDMIENAIQLFEKGFKDASYTEDQTKTFMDIYKAFATPAFLAFSQFINKAFMGLIFSLFLASFLSTRKNLPKTNNSTNFENKEQ